MENRFAILIGINDYDSTPLSFCVNDGEELKKMLITHAGFHERNIHPIFSSSETSVKDITGALFAAIEKIRAGFSESDDSIFFFFAGHGAEKDGKSNLMFHDSFQSIRGIFEQIESLKPKMQFYVIDACESGGKTLARARGNSEKELLEEFISASSGAMFLYACQSTESAFEIESVKHGIMTYYFIEALKNEKLYDEGVLTPGRIQDYVSKNVAMKSKFAQNPVIESRTTGYYPFATIGLAPSGEIQNIDVPAGSVDERRGESVTVAYDKETRIQLQSIAASRLHETLTRIIDKYKLSHRTQFAPIINDLPFRTKSSLISSIVYDAVGNLESIKGTIGLKKVPVYSNSISMQFLAGLGERPIKEYKDEPQILSEHEYLSCSGYISVSNSIEISSFGIGGIVYQAKWGLVISTFLYQLDWDGEADAIIKNISKISYSFLINNDAFGLIPIMEFENLERLDSFLEKWNEKRKQELRQFGAV